MAGMYVAFPSTYCTAERHSLSIAPTKRFTHLMPMGWLRKWWCLNCFKAAALSYFGNLSFWNIWECLQVYSRLACQTRFSRIAEHGYFRHGPIHGYRLHTSMSQQVQLSRQVQKLKNDWATTCGSSLSWQRKPHRGTDQLNKKAKHSRAQSAGNKWPVYFKSRGLQAHVKSPTKTVKACLKQRETGDHYWFQTGSPCMPTRRTRVPVRAVRLPPRPRSPSSTEPLMLSNPQHFWICSITWN